MRIFALMLAALTLTGCDLLLTVSSAALFDSPVEESRESSRDDCLSQIPNDTRTPEAEREIYEYCQDRGL